MRNMMLQVRNFSLIALCALLAVANSQQLTAGSQFTVSATLTVEFAETNYSDGTNERFRWTDIADITTAQTPWRVLTHEEWTYLLITRDVNKNALGQVDGANGLIILPDSWTQPSAAPALKPVSQGVAYDNNRYSATEWNLMKSAGAVFLPCRGASADGSVVDNPTTLGAYWASTQENDTKGYSITFDGYQINDQITAAKTNYYSIRLVKDVGTPTAIDETSQKSNVESQKLFRDGQLFILRGDELFNAQGARVK